MTARWYRQDPHDWFRINYTDSNVVLTPASTRTRTIPASDRRVSSTQSRLRRTAGGSDLHVIPPRSSGRSSKPPRGRSSDLPVRERERDSQNSSKRADQLLESASTAASRTGRKGAVATATTTGSGSSPTTSTVIRPSRTTRNVFSGSTPAIPVAIWDSDRTRDKPITAISFRGAGVYQRRKPGSPSQRGECDPVSPNAAPRGSPPRSQFRIGSPRACPASLGGRPAGFQVLLFPRVGSRRPHPGLPDRSRLVRVLRGSPRVRPPVGSFAGEALGFGGVDGTHDEIAKVVTAPVV